MRACNVELVRAEFYRQYPAEGGPREKAETRRKAFQRALKSAQDNTLIMLREIERDAVRVAGQKRNGSMTGVTAGQCGTFGVSESKPDVPLIGS